MHCGLSSEDTCGVTTRISSSTRDTSCVRLSSDLDARHVGPGHDRASREFNFRSSIRILGRPSQLPRTRIRTRFVRSCAPESRTGRQLFLFTVLVCFLTVSARLKSEDNNAFSLVAQNVQRSYSITAWVQSSSPPTHSSSCAKARTRPSRLKRSVYKFSCATVSVTLNSFPLLTIFASRSPFSSSRAARYNEFEFKDGSFVETRETSPCDIAKRPASPTPSRVRIWSCQRTP